MVEIASNKIMEIEHTALMENVSMMERVYCFQLSDASIVDEIGSYIYLVEVSKPDRYGKSYLTVDSERFGLLEAQTLHRLIGVGIQVMNILEGK